MALCKPLSNCSSSLKITNASLFCRYHRENNEYPITRLTNEGLCPEAFHSLYPLAFSMLYADVKGGTAECSCPGVDGNIIFELVQTPVGLMHRLINGLKEALGSIYPLEIIRYKVFIKVKQPNPACPYNYKQGRFFMFNLGKEKAICPAAFYNIYPLVIPWAAAPNSKAYPCPDHRRNILFRLEGRNTPMSNSDKMDVYPCCRSLNDLAINVRSVSGVCKKGYRAGDLFRVKDILKDLNFPCLAALHTTYPYIYTLLKGGKLGFYSNNYRSAVVQCPNADVKVEIKVEKLKKTDKILIRIINSKRLCPLGLSKGLEVSFFPKEFNHFCMSTLMAIYPYLIHPGFPGQEICCPSQNGKVYFTVHNLQK